MSFCIQVRDLSLSLNQIPEPEKEALDLHTIYVAQLSVAAVHSDLT